MTVKRAGRLPILATVGVCAALLAPQGTAAAAPAFKITALAGTSVQAYAVNEAGGIGGNSEANGYLQPALWPRPQRHHNYSDPPPTRRNRERCSTSTSSK